MTEVLNHLIAQLNSSVFTLLGILLVAFWGVGAINRLIERFCHHEKQLGKFDSLHDRTIKMEGKLDLIYLNTQRVPVALSHSPISLTPVGVEIAETIHANAIFERYKERLIASVQAKSPKNAYDIQVEAMKLTRESMLGMLDSGELNTVKEVAFQKGILAEDVMMVFGVMLRDSILASRGIAVADVDQHAPAGLKIP